MLANDIVGVDDVALALGHLLDDAFESEVSVIGMDGRSGLIVGDFAEMDPARLERSPIVFGDRAILCLADLVR